MVDEKKMSQAILELVACGDMEFVGEDKDGQPICRLTRKGSSFVEEQMRQAGINPDDVRGMSFQEFASRLGFTEVT